MKTGKILKTLALVAGLASGTAAYAANGDIYEIRPCDSQGKTVSAYTTIDSPMTSGETVYFNLRLVQRTKGDTTTTWKLAHVGLNEQIIDDLLFPLEIGIYVSGELRWAKLEDVKNLSSRPSFTDFIFSYTTRPGDFALPIVLACEDGSVQYSSNANNYLLNNTDKWKITTDSGSEPNMFIGTHSGYTAPDPGSPVKDWALTKCGFYVKTVDFDSKWESAGTLWRSVHEGSTITVGQTPSLVMSAAAEDKVSLYVWSTDDSAVAVSGGEVKELVVGYDSGANPITKTTRVGKVTIEGGATYANFDIEGVAQGESCKLVLSQWDHYNYNTTMGVPEQEKDYLTVPVKCVEPLPASIMIVADDDPAYVAISNGWRKAATVLNVYLTQAVEDDLVVTVTPKIGTHTDLTMSDYVMFSTVSDNVKTRAALTETATVTIPKGQSGLTLAQKVYVYLFRADSNTDADTLDFYPSITTTTIPSDRWIPTGINIIARNPEFLSPEDGDTISAVAGEEFPLELIVADTYADEHIAAPEDGYKIRVKLNDAKPFEDLAGTYYISADGSLRDSSGNLPVIKYTTSSATSVGGVFTTQVEITEPINKNKATVKLVAAVAAPKSVTVTKDKDIYNEGEQATFTIQLSSDNDTGAPLYAFLRTSAPDMTAGKFSALGRKCVITPDMTSADWALTSGVIINPDMGGPGKEAMARVLLLDGENPLGGGSSVSFEVVLCATPDYNDSAIITGYSSNFANFQVMNVEPSIKRIEMNGIPSEEDGFIFPNKVPKGSSQTFEAIVSDPGRYDLTDNFKYKWTFSLSGVGTIGTPVVSVNDPTVTYDFPRAGEWTIKLQVMDKDMDDWAETPYSVHVSVLDNPSIEIEAPTSIAESDRDSVVRLYLSYWDSMYTGTLRIKLTVSEWLAGVTNPGKLVLDESYASPDPSEPGVYYIDVNDSLPVDLAIQDADGTQAARTSGFKIAAEIVSTDILPTSGKAANEYYIGSTARMRVENEAPAVSVNPLDENTNRWVVAGGVATGRPLIWNIDSDVDADFTTVWPNGAGPGILVKFTGCANAYEEYVTDPMNATGTFYPDFADTQGDQDITLTIKDKDNGVQTFVWHFTVTASKFLQATASGPSGGLANSQLSQKLRQANGRGEGHIFIGSSATFSSSDGFTAKWNCGNLGSVPAYAFGYKVDNPVDNGTLDKGRDVAIDPDGDAGGTMPSVFYTYGKDRDSYFFAWLIHTKGEDGSLTSAFLGDTLAPESPLSLTFGDIPLPSEKNEDESYPTTSIEGVFALEYESEDNLGDINQDGIPDIYAGVTSWSHESEEKTLIEWAGGSSATESCLLNLAKANIQDELLPGVFQSPEKIALVDEGRISYGMTGKEFTAKTKIRGFHEGLNDTANTTSDPSFSDNEQAAFEAFEAANPGAVKLVDWTPEPAGPKYSRMNPATDDTDGDGLPDAWEYFFWYQAHVWAPAQAPLGLPLDAPKYGVHQNFVFERFDPKNIAKGTEITCEEVEARFNPCVTLSDAEQAENPDFDGDGLSDLEELLIGTNPCHWDSDGDGMCDGWEVMMCLDPLKANQGGNDDGDYMACYSTADALTWREDKSADPYAAGTTNYVFAGLVPFVDYMPVLNYTLRDLDIECFKFEPMLQADETTPVRYGREEDLALSGHGVWGMAMVKNVKRVRCSLPKGTQLYEGIAFVLVHNQVYDAFGFDPRTGWKMNSEGYVADRWNPSVNKGLSGGDTTGLAVNTKAYSNYDEYLVMQYRRDYKLVYSNDTEWDDSSVWLTLRNKTTNPSNPLAADEEASTNGTETASGESATANYAQTLAAIFKEMGNDKTPVTTNGADTDGDGVPDGWELYTFRCPNKAPNASEDGYGKGGAYDFDDDGLSYAQEFAGTDSCNAYSNCPSVYANHPGNKTGWFNKFFPTHPGSRRLMDNDYVQGNTDGWDTDRDGIPDGVEGGNWDAEFYNDGETYYGGIKLGFVYGEPADNASCCIRGGGMNPCTIDTDLDGIPDGWEMQHAGVPVKLPGMTVVAPNNGGKTGKIKIGRGTFAADGVLTRSDSLTNDVFYVAGGMDATWGGDSTSDTISEGKSWDALLGVSRDVDFDHDGLQNYQEYLVQSARHLRYDDLTTPIMGRVLEEGVDGAPYKQTFMGYVPFDATDPNAFAAAAARAWYGEDAVETTVVTTGYRMVITYIDPAAGTTATNAIAETMETYKISPSATEVYNRVNLTGGSWQLPWTETGWRALGYFARPLRAWDRATLSGKFARPLYMLPVTGGMTSTGTATGYASTDPRMADTDSDGMDDYWELFHGLNPMLGSDCGEPDKTAWLTGKRGDIISAVYCYGEATDVTLDKFNAFLNEWIYPTYNSDDGRFWGRKPCEYDAIKAPQAYDPILYPWIMGSPAADADGDGLRNNEERLLANITDPGTTHTDPSPRWFTDRTAEASYVRQYYGVPTNMVLQAWYPKGVTGATENNALYAGAVSGLGYMFAFEENEGYDTDGDFKPDAFETVSTTTVSSDPLRYDDPSRRQALYLDGVNSYAMTTEIGSRIHRSVDLFREFTVECWICPEAVNKEQTVLERSCAYPGSSINGASVAIRANFRIGIDSAGQVYGMFDNSDAVESGLNQPLSCQIVKGGKLKANEWKHIALAYDGKTLSLYENGTLANFATTGLIPANGIYYLHQGLTETNQFPVNEYNMYDHAMFIGARPVAKSENALRPVVLDEDGTTHLESFDNMREWYKGWIDEVRVWDGARSAADIKADYRKAYTMDDALANRDEVFAGLRAGYTRNGNTVGYLVPELVMHYNFVSLPAAVNAADVAQEPSGFALKVRGAAASDYASNPDISTEGLYPGVEGALKGGDVDNDIAIAWWRDSAVRSTVYTSKHVVPSIKNTVAHLPAIDGTCADSVYYSKWFGGVYTLASEFGISSFAYANGGNPYGKAIFDEEYYNRVLTARRRAEQLGSDYVMQYEMTDFTIRSLNTGDTDLVPMGGAYAKLCTAMWDGAAADAWEFTGEDTDGDGLPDWWESYAAGTYGLSGDIAWDTPVTVDGKVWEAGKLYIYELYHGLQPDGKPNSEYASTYDTDGNAIPDWWEKFYGVEGEAPDADSDGDGLSNYSEYILSEVFDLGVTFDPTKPMSVNGFDLDYFVKIGSLYAGEVFTDFDMIEDALEDQWGVDYANRYVWDALSDKDEDGWSNFAEARYYNYNGRILAPQISHTTAVSGEMADMPIPALRLTLRYNGDRPLTASSGDGDSSSRGSSSGDSESSSSGATLSPIVVQTFTKDGLVVPDATFTVTPGATVEGTHYVGAWSDRVVRGTLAPGYVDARSVELDVLEATDGREYAWNVKSPVYYGLGEVLKFNTKADGSIESIDVVGTYAQYRRDVNWYGNDDVKTYSSEGTWDKLKEIKVVGNDDSGTARILNKGEQVGTVNLLTGDYELDLHMFGNEIGVSTNGEIEASLKSSLFRFSYKATPPVLSSNKMKLNLGEANSGYVKEGKNMVVAFYDIDGDGKYTAGEPFGCAKTDVAWRQGVAEIELTDTTPIITRADLLTGATDRNMKYGIDDGDNTNLVAGVLSGGAVQRLRVVRTLVNGYAASALGVTNRALVDKEVQLQQRSFFYEGDVLEDGSYDLDWKYFEDEIAGASGVKSQNMDPTEVTYRIVLGNGSAEPGDTNNLFSVATVRHYDAKGARKMPTALSPGETDSLVFANNPTFKWTMDGNDTYTAFQVYLRTYASSETVWSSGVRRAPAPDLNGVYTFEADAFVGDELEDNTLYRWRVTMYNAKFRDNYWSTDLRPFRMVAPGKGAGYGEIPVCVRYFGPTDVASKSKFVVEAFESPDFTGVPAARVIATTDVTKSGKAHVANATLTGLPNGQYYVRAYADLDTSVYGKARRRDKYESWGYACAREKSSDMPFSPLAIAVDSATDVETVDVYVEDVDTNGNLWPDAYELIKNGGSLYGGANGKYEVPLDNCPISTSLAGAIAKKAVSASASAGSGLAAHLANSFNAPAYAVLAAGVNPDSIKYVSGDTIMVENKVTDVEITGVEIVDGKVVIGVDGKLDAEEPNGMGVFNIVAESEKTVTCKVYSKANLADDWTLAAEKAVAVGTGPVEVELPADTGSASGFFKVEIDD